MPTDDPTSYTATPPSLRNGRGARDYLATRKDPGFAQRRIAQCEARVRKWARALALGAADAEQGLAKAREDLAHWREVVALAKANGSTFWSASDFTAGDYVQFDGVWYVVVHVNRRSLTIPEPLDPSTPLADQDRTARTCTRPYDRVQDRSPAEAVNNQGPSSP